MRQDDKQAFARDLLAMGELYNKEVSSAVVSIWWESLKDYDYQAVSQALRLHVTNPDSGQFFPKPADVVKLIGGTTQDAALMAWAKVLKAIARVGTYTDVVFDDPIIHAAIEEMGGWVKLGQVKEDELPFRAKEFENRYRAYARLGGATVYPPVLMGISNSNNSLKGYEAQPPALIGEPSKCELVLEGGKGSTLQVNVRETVKRLAA